MIVRHMSYREKFYMHFPVSLLDVPLYLLDIDYILCDHFVGLLLGRNYHSITFLVSYTIYTICSFIILVEDVRVHERWYLIIMFWIASSGAIVNIGNKGLMMIQIALTGDLSSRAVRHRLKKFCFWAIIISIVMVGVFQLPAGFAKDLAVKDGFTAAWQLHASLISWYFTIVYVLHGNSIIKLLEKAMDQGPEVQVSIAKMKKIRGQMLTSTGVSGFVLLFWGTFPYLRIAGNSVMYPSMWIFWGLSNSFWILTIRKEASDLVNSSIRSPSKDIPSISQHSSINDFNKN